MGYLDFEKQELINLEKSLNLEVLRTSRTGGYSFSTISGCNTRKYHGLLVSRIEGAGQELHVLLASIDETILLNPSEFNLGIHAYKYGNYSPKGHKYLHHFDWNHIPILSYQIGEAVLIKESIFISGNDQLLIKYTLTKATQAAIIRFRPFFAFRNQHNLSKANHQADSTAHEVPNGLGFRIYPSYPMVYLQFSKKIDFSHSPHWLHDVEYKQEMQRGYEFNEDLFTTGVFETTLNNDESIVVSASLNSCDCRSILHRFDTEIQNRTPRNSFKNCLCNAGQQFFVHSPNGMNIKAGFPWINARARDLFVSLPGLLLCSNEKAVVEPIIYKICSDINQFIETGLPPVDVDGYTEPDTLLWAVRALEMLMDSNGVDVDKLKSTFASIMAAIAQNKIAGLTLHDNGLLYVDGRKRPVSWMNSICFGEQTVKRTGYLIEINALWFNALSYYVSNFDTSSTDKTDFSEWILRCGKSMTELFCIENENFLYDFVDPDSRTHDKTIRPNMVFAASLPFSPFSRIQQKAIIDTIERNLLTPRGLRSLSPNHPDYCGQIGGDHEQRNHDCFKGTAWPWLLGAFFDAYLKIFDHSGTHFLKSLLSEFENELHQNCIGTIAEYYNGNPPHEAGGAVSFAMNVAELLRITNKLEIQLPLKQTL
jgi:predicted glycogen debranching enzyme